jgi:hypothetical protein
MRSGNGRAVRPAESKGISMTWLWWLGLLVGVLVFVAVGLQLLGEQRWANLMRLHIDQLDSAEAENPIRSPPQSRHEAGFSVTELEGLPLPVQRYFRAVLRDGQPSIRAATITMAGTINMSATGEQWKPFTSTQRAVNSVSSSHPRLRPGFLWNAEVAMFPGVPARVEDSYIAGQGQVIAKLFGLFTVARASGGGEMARGEFMR